MKRVRMIALLWVAVLVSAGFAGTLTREIHKTAGFKEGGLIRLKNVNGGIKTFGWEKDSVSVLAVIKVKAGDRKDAEEFMDRVTIDVRELGDVLSIEFDYPRNEESNDFFGWLFGRRITVSIDFEIHVPLKSDLELRDTNGGISVEEVEGKIYLGTTNGGINGTALKGSIEARSTNGGITIEMSTLDPESNNEIRTTNGGIKLTLPGDVQADLSASVVNGGIHTDFPVEVRGKLNNKSVDGRINGGGCQIDMHTVNGSISIYGASHEEKEW